MPSGGTDAVYEVMRGALDQFPVGSGAAETCVDSGVAGQSAQDGTTPSPGSGFYYLVRARNICGAGTYGSASGGSPWMTSVCP